MRKNKSSVLKDLRRIPGVGKEISQDMYEMGFRAVDELKGKDPEKLYLQLCELEGRHVDRCMLYVFRCAVYFAENKKHDPDLLKWWRWKDKD